jgi:hypothetical protein
MPRLLAQRDIDLALILEWSPQQMRDVGVDVETMVRFVVDHRFAVHDIESGKGVSPTDLSAIPYTNLMLRRA